MMIPVSRDQVLRYTPPTLENAPAPPVFLMRPATWMIRRRWQEICSEQGLNFPSQEMLNQAMRESLTLLWSAENAEREMPRVEEAFLKLSRDELVGQEFVEFAQLEALVMERSEPYRVLATQRSSFIRYSPYAALSLLLVGWENLDTPFDRIGGEIPFEALETVEREVMALETELKAKRVPKVAQPGTSWLMLGNHAIQSLDLTGVQRKNSLPESLSAGTPDGSSQDGTETPAGGQSEMSGAEAKSASGSDTAPSRARKTSKKPR